MPIATPDSWKHQPAPAQAQEIVCAVRELLQAPASTKAAAPDFDRRVAARLLVLLERELAQGGAALPGDSARLCAAVDSAQRAWDEPALLSALWRQALAQGAIDCPDYRWCTPGKSDS